jgi:microcystin degradation protein MlrC
MLESGPSGSVRGVPSNGHPYREPRPKTVIARRPMLYGLDHGRTQRGPMAELIARGEALEQNGDALVISICAGFSHADIRDVGPSVTVTVDGNNPRGQTIAEEFMDYAWETRESRQSSCCRSRKP